MCVSLSIDAAPRVRRKSNPSFHQALLLCANFRATCLAKPFLKTFSHYETSCFTGVKLGNVSFNLSRFDDHMRLTEHFHWLVRQTVATHVAGQMLHCTMLKNSLQLLRKIELNSTFRNGFCNWFCNVFRPCKVCYIGQ